ncbi:hypothetical protein DFH09DRAFT_1461962 [Mycena vulgaris]|nr:hypothetical protein DFH09DRAFT_1461962 [Mycena vulgaris]
MAPEAAEASKRVADIHAPTRTHTHPYLRLVRHLRITLDFEILAEVRSQRLTALWNDRPESDGIISLFAGLMGLQTGRRLKLWCITVKDIQSLREMFSLRAGTPLALISLDDNTLASLASLPSRAYHDLTAPPWSSLRRAHSAKTPCGSFTLSPLRRLDTHQPRHRAPDHPRRPAPHARRAFPPSSGIHTLRIDARKATPNFSLAELPALPESDIFSGFGGGALATSLLASIPAANRIANEASLRRLDATIAALPLPALRAVEIEIRKTDMSWSTLEGGGVFALRMRGLGALFAQLDARECLRLACVNNGVRTNL